MARFSERKRMLQMGVDYLSQVKLVLLENRYYLEAEEREVLSKLEVITSWTMVITRSSGFS